MNAPCSLELSEPIDKFASCNICVLSSESWHWPWTSFIAPLLCLRQVVLSFLRFLARFLLESNDSVSAPVVFNWQNVPTQSCFFHFHFHFHFVFLSSLANALSLSSLVLLHRVPIGLFHYFQYHKIPWSQVMNLLKCCRESQRHELDKNLTGTRKQMHRKQSSVTRTDKMKAKNTRRHTGKTQQKVTHLLEGDEGGGGGIAEEEVMNR